MVMGSNDRTIEPIYHIEFLVFRYIKTHEYMLVAAFLRSSVKLYGKHMGYTQMEQHGILRHVSL
jgi:hypothetical protein